MIRNAVSYTAEGTEVQIASKAASRPTEPATRADFACATMVAAFPKNLSRDIFLPFYRVGDARDRFSGGSGLGLSITERAVRLHGGTVKAQNCKDGGLLVEMQLPFATK